MVVPRLDGNILYMEETVIPAVGTIGATLYQRFAHWCRRNKELKSKTHYKNERWWTWDSYGALSKDYPYWSERQIRSACDKLRKTGLVKCRRKQGGASYWYSIIDISDWIESKDFEKLDLIKQKQIYKIINRRDLAIRSSGKNVSSCDKNVISCDKNVITNTVNNTVTPHIKEEETRQKKIIQLTESDITKSDQLKITYNNFIIDTETLNHMYRGFEIFFKNAVQKSDDLEKAVRGAITSQTFLNEHPAWLRLIYASKEGLLKKHSFILDVLKSRLNSEIYNNPGIASVLRKALGQDFDFSFLNLNINSEIRYQKQILKKLDKEIDKRDIANN